DRRRRQPDDQGCGLGDHPERRRAQPEGRLDLAGLARAVSRPERSARVADFIGTGWGFPLGFEPSGSIAMVRGEDKIEQAIRLILSTYPGERPMRPQWGSTLRDNVFGGTSQENIAAITREVNRSIDFWEPRAAVSEVLVYPD